MELFLLCGKIFFARILDVTISTFRQNIMLKGQNLFGGILAFIEILIWFFVAREALLIPIESLFVPISYALGYATGTLLGAFLAKTLIKGVIGIQIITDEDKKEMINALKLRGYSFNILRLESGFNSQPKIMIFLEVNKKSLKKVQKLIRKFDADAFVALSDTKQVFNGTLK